MKKRSNVSIMTGGGGPAEPVLRSECVLTDNVKFFVTLNLIQGLSSDASYR